MAVRLLKSDAERIFRKLNLQQRRNTKHVYGWLIVDGKRVLPLHYSYGRGEMPGHVPDRFRAAMHLDRPQFANMVRCTMSREEYVAILRERGLV
jgi:hypothetical protein